jgi:uncharacterized protein (TIRG00374 family)
MKQKKNTFWEVLIAFLGLLLAIYLSYLTFKATNFDSLLNRLYTMSWGWVLLSMLFGYLAYVFRGLRWHLLIKPLGFESKTSTLIHAIAFGYLFNVAIPRSGEVMRCTAVNKVNNTPVSTLFGHVLLERLIDFFLLGICVLLALFFNYQDFLSFSNELGSPDIKTYIYIFLGFIVFLFLFKIRSNILPITFLEKIDSFFNGIQQGFLSIKNIQHKFLFSLYTILIWLCYLLMTLVCFYCFQETQHLSVGHGIFILVAGGFGMVMPTPAGIGSYHFFVAAALVTINIDKDVAAAFALVVHTSQTIMIIVSGVIATIMLTLQRGQLSSSNLKDKNYE